LTVNVSPAGRGDHESLVIQCGFIAASSRVLRRIML
jgi:hypothetical protein